MPAVTSGYGVGECASPGLPIAPNDDKRVRLMSLALWKSPRLKFQIGREAHANVGS